MRVLLLTGRLAAKRVMEEARRIEAELGHDVEVLVLSVDIAALMSVRWLKKALEPMREGLRKYDAIILPGYISGSATELEEEFGMRFVKGTKHICDLLEALRRLGLTGLSSDVPADALLGKGTDVEGRLRALEEAVSTYIDVGDVRVPIRPPPMRLISEVYYSPELGVEELIEECRYRAGEGADIICLGIREPLAVSPDELSPILKALRDEFSTIAIDSPRPAHMREALKHGFDMVMSISPANIEHVLSIIEPLATYVLVAPRETRYDEKLECMKKMVYWLERAGARKIVIDPLLEPPIESGMMDSLLAYKRLGEEFVEFPFLMGLCNVVELVDADSPGLTALLTALAGELGVSLLLITEESRKTMNSTAETSVAAKMISIALHERRPPKDLGISLLRLKDKVNKDIGLHERELVGVEIVDCWPEEGPLPRPLDRMGFFKITLDRKAGLILVLYRGRKGALLLRAPSAKPILREVMERGLVGTQEHLAYLALELEKAEIALQVGKSYVQDEELF